MQPTENRSDERFIVGSDTKQPAPKGRRLFVCVRLSISLRFLFEREGHTLFLRLKERNGELV